MRIPYSTYSTTLLKMRALTSLPMLKMRALAELMMTASDVTSEEDKKGVTISIKKQPRNAIINTNIYHT